MSFTYYQRTLKRKISCSGIGLHSGRKVAMTIRPAAENQGVVFVRSDLPSADPIEAHHRNLQDVTYATTLGRGQSSVQTVEHLLAAFAGLGVDNAVVELDANEVPIMDGSAAPFVYLLREAGIREQPSPKTYIQIKKELSLDLGDRRIMVRPANALRISYGIAFKHPLIGRQEISIQPGSASFEEKVAPARTFGFLDEIEALRKHGLIKGGSLDNAIVVGRHRILNGRLRFRDEFVRHKVLDAMGDLFLLGKPLLGHILTEKGGHALHGKLVEAILRTPRVWRYVTAPVPSRRPSAKVEVAVRPARVPVSVSV